MRSKAAIGIVGAAAVAMIWFMRGGGEPAPKPTLESGAEAPAASKREGMRQGRRSEGAAQSEGMAEDVARLSERRRADREGWATRSRAGRRNNTMGDAEMSPAEGSPDQSPSGRPASGGRRPAAAVGGEPAPLSESDIAEFDSLKQTMLNDNDPKKRMDALESLETFDDEMLMPVLVQALNDRDAEVRLAALQELANYDDDEVSFDTFANAMYDSDPEVRLEALRIVGDSEDARAMSLVQRALNDPNEDVREEAEDIVDIASD